MNNKTPKEHELLVRLKLIQNSINRVLSHVDKGTLEIPEIQGYSLLTDLNDIHELCDLNHEDFKKWREALALQHTRYVISIPVYGSKEDVSKAMDKVAEVIDVPYISANICASEEGDNFFDKEY